MTIFTLLETITLLLVIAFFVTQVVIPLVGGRPLFPIFRREAELLEKLSGLRQRKHERDLEKEIRKQSNP